MSTIEVKCIDQTLTVMNAPLIASGDIQTDYVHFEFCDKWTDFAKFGVFYRDKDHVYRVLIDEFTKLCIIPKEVLQDEGIVYFGVFGIKTDEETGELLERKTSEILKYRIKQGILTEGDTPNIPTPDIYEQILTNYAELIAQAHVFTPFTDEEMEAILNGTYVPTGDDDPEVRENIFAEVVTARGGNKSLDSRLDIIEGRVNQLSTLPEGSTTGDAELADIRVGADGKVYSNAGEAVRSQITKLDIANDELRTSMEESDTALDERIKENTQNLNTHTHDDRYYTESEIDTKFNDLKNTLDNKINTSDVLSYEEIMATTPLKDLDKCPPSASGLKTLRDKISNQIVDINSIPAYRYVELGVSPNDQDFFKAWCNKIFTDHRDKLDSPIIANVTPNSTGVVIGRMYSDGTSPKYAGFIYFTYASAVFNFGYNNGTWYWRQI